MTNSSFSAVQDVSLSNAIITFSKIIDTESSVFIDDKIPVSDAINKDN